MAAGKTDKQAQSELRALGVPQIEQWAYLAMADDIPLTAEQEACCDDSIAAACAHIRALRPMNMAAGGLGQRNGAVSGIREYVRSSDRSSFVFEVQS